MENKPTSGCWIAACDCAVETRQSLRFFKKANSLVRLISTHLSKKKCCSQIWMISPQILGGEDFKKSLKFHHLVFKGIHVSLIMQLPKNDTYHTHPVTWKNWLGLVGQPNLVGGFNPFEKY